MRPYKAYKLIKTYPKSPELNTEVFKNPRLSDSSHWYIDSSGRDYRSIEIENHPEFWQPIEQHTDPLKTEVIDTIIECIDIRGIDLELYRFQIEKSNIFERLKEIFK